MGVGAILLACTIDNQVAPASDTGDDTEGQDSGLAGQVTTTSEVSACAFLPAALGIAPDVCPQGPEESACRTAVERRQQVMADELISWAGVDSLDAITDPLNCSIQLTLWNRYRQTDCSDYAQTAIVLGDHVSELVAWAEAKESCAECVDESFPLPFLYGSAWSMLGGCHAGNQTSVINAVYRDPQDFVYDPQAVELTNTAIIDINDELRINGEEYTPTPDGEYETLAAQSAIEEDAAAFLDWSAMIAAGQPYECDGGGECAYYGVVKLAGNI